MEYPDLVEVEGRANRYWTLDGIPEMVMGFVWVIWGVVLLFPRSDWFSLLIMLAPALAANWIIKKLKNKFTFPRGGYVKPHGPTRSQRLLFVLVGGLISAAFALVLGFSVRHRTLAEVAAPAIAVLMAIGFLIASRRRGMHHLLWYAVLSLVAGAALYPFKLGWTAWPWYLAVMGVCFVAVGAYRLRVFTRSTPLQGGNEP